ncbi:hypothetical protein HEP84_57580 [Streptomyces sp. RLB1-33]
MEQPRRAYQSAGDLGRRAISLFEQTHTDFQRVLGGDHPDTLGSRNNLDRQRDPVQPLTLRDDLGAVVVTQDKARPRHEQRQRVVAVLVSVGAGLRHRRHWEHELTRQRHRLPTRRSAGGSSRGRWE